MFCLVRHGEPDYSEMDTKVYRGFGAQMCPLTQEGCVQIKNLAKNVQLQNASLIISSPYGRALQTAAILSKELGVDIVVETDLHEWLANKHYIYENNDVASNNLKEFDENNGSYPDGIEKDWETFEITKNRATRVLEKYKDYNKVIVVCHGRLMQAVTGFHHPDYGEFFEFNL